MKWANNKHRKGSSSLQLIKCEQLTAMFNKFIKPISPDKRRARKHIYTKYLSFQMKFDDELNSFRQAWIGQQWREWRDIDGVWSVCTSKLDWKDLARLAISGRWYRQFTKDSLWHLDRKEHQDYESCTVCREKESENLNLCLVSQHWSCKKESLGCLLCVNLYKIAWRWTQWSLCKKKMKHL